MKQPAKPSIHANRATVIAMTVPLVGKLLAPFNYQNQLDLFASNACKMWILFGIVYPRQCRNTDWWRWMSLSKTVLPSPPPAKDTLMVHVLFSWCWPVFYQVADLFSDSLILQDVIEGHQETAVNHDWHRFGTSCLYVWNKIWPAAKFIGLFRWCSVDYFSTSFLTPLGKMSRVCG